MVQSVVAGNGVELNVYYLSDVLGAKVYDKSGALLGRVDDLMATMGERYPEVEACVLRQGKARALMPIGADEFLQLAKAKRVAMGAPPAELQVGERQFLVRDTLYDKQIVDVNGAKVERVNDIQFFLHGGKSFLVHVDVGFTGLTRRLGCERGVRSLVRLLGRELKDDFISWKFVQPLPEKVTSPVQVALRQEQIKQLHAGELADIIEDLDRDERVNLVESMDVEHAADALEEADLAVQTAIIRDLKPEKAADIIEEMEPAAAADLLDTLPRDAQKTIMAAMEADERAQMERLSHAEEDTAASLMTVEYIACPKSCTAAQAIAEVQRAAREIESINYVYCLDDKQRLRGVVSLRDLILADAQAKLSDIMNRRLAVLHPDDDWEEIAEQMMKFQFRALPVLNDEGCMEGVVTFKHSFEELLPYYYKMAS